MDEDTKQKINALTEKTDKIYISVEKTRKYFLTTLIITVVMIVFPLIGLVFAIPAFLSTYSSLGAI